MAKRLATEGERLKLRRCNIATLLAVKLTPRGEENLPSITPSGGCYVVAEPTRTTNDVSAKSLILMVGAHGLEPWTR